jgi:hypothetical protein
MSQYALVIEAQKRFEEHEIILVGDGSTDRRQCQPAARVDIATPDGPRAHRQLGSVPMPAAY